MTAPVAQAPISAAKTGFYGAPTTSPAAMAAAQRALQQTGYHAAVQAQPGVPQRVGAVPPPLAQPMPIAAQGHSIPQGLGAMPQQAPVPMGGQPQSYGGPAMGQQPAPMMPQHSQQSVPMMQQHQQPAAPMPQHGGGLRLAGQQHAMESHAATATMNTSNVGAPQPTSIQMMRPDVGTPVKRSAPAGRPQSKSDTRPNAGQAGRAAPMPASTPQAQPKKGKGMMYAAIFVVVALGIGAVVAKMVLKVF